jgi:class 3 adenylate cyclase/tetratricopeptide (TPR) repeat protein
MRLRLKVVTVPRARMKCPECQTVVAQEDKFCRLCGHDLRKASEIPSVEYTKPNSYTPKHLSDKILTSRSSIQGERKLVTVLFADVANYTSIAEKLDPEKVHQIMDGCFKLLMDEIHRYEGTINQFTGDGIMALFGAPLAHEDHAQRACLAANGIQESLEGYGKDLEERHGIVFKMRVGLNSGPVVVGSIGDDLRMDYTAIGDTTNLAYRIQSIAEPGSVLISENTYKMVRESFEFSSQGKVSLKGKEEPVEVFKLRKKREFHRPRLGYEREIYSEMVGRDNELAKLELQVMKAVTGEGSIVNIIGEAGIGKSRLVAELRNREAMKRVTLLEGRAISMGRNLSFHPIIDLLRNWARIKEDDSESVAFDKLKSAIRNVHPEEVDEVLPFVATLMGMKLSGRYGERVKGIEGEALEKLILKNVRSLIIKASEITPIVIVMEDLHWADTSSIELLESLFRLAQTQRIVFVNLFRPGYKETSDRISENAKDKYPTHSVGIALQPLDEQGSEVLINGMLKIPGFPLSVRKQIVERAGGNPFFIEEVIRSLIDEGVVAYRGGAFAVTKKMDAVVVPHSISDVLMARIDRLEEDTRNLIKVASVIGRSFFHRVLTQVATTIQNIDQRLAYLKDIQLIRERSRMKELEYFFKHALAQEAAYESILFDRRKELHRNVAQSIETVFSERLHEFYGMLAFHYSRAEDETKAEEYLVKAGEEALRSSASSEALYYYQQALDLYLKTHGDAADPRKIAMIERNIGLAFYHRGRAVEAEEYFSKALAFYGITSPKSNIAVTFKAFTSFLHFLIGIYLPFLKWKRTPSPDDDQVFDLLFRRGLCFLLIDTKRLVIEALLGAKHYTYFDIGRLESGIGMMSSYGAMFSWTGISYSLSKRVLKFCEPKVSKDNIRTFLPYVHSATLHNYFSGNWSLPQEYDDELVNRYLSLGGYIHTALYYVEWHACFDIDQGRFPHAHALVDKLAEIADVYENDLAMSYKFRVNIELLMTCRKLDDGVNEVNTGISFITKQGLKVYYTYFYGIKARLQMLINDFVAAKESLDIGKEYLLEIKDAPYFLNSYLTSEFLYYLGKLHGLSKNSAEWEWATNGGIALKAGRKLIRNSRKTAPGRTEAFRLMGTYFWLVGKQRKALTWWKRSIKEGERLGARPELSRTYLEVGKRLKVSESKYKELDGLGAEEYLTKARTMFQDMGLQWDLDELEKISATK